MTQKEIWFQRNQLNIFIYAWGENKIKGENKYFSSQWNLVHRI